MKNWNKQNMWFRRKDIAKILGYTDTDQALRKNIVPEDKKPNPSTRRETLGAEVDRQFS